MSDKRSETHSWSCQFSVQKQYMPSHPREIRDWIVKVLQNLILICLYKPFLLSNSMQSQVSTVNSLLFLHVLRAFLAPFFLVPYPLRLQLPRKSLSILQGQPWTSQKPCWHLTRHNHSFLWASLETFLWVYLFYIALLFKYMSGLHCCIR